MRMSPSRCANALGSDADVLNQMPNLKLIVSVGGRENPSIDKDVAMGRGVLVCYTARRRRATVCRRRRQATRR